MTVLERPDHYSGTWKVVHGSERATAMGIGGPYMLRLLEGEAKIKFLNVTPITATVQILSFIEWQTYDKYNQPVTRVPLSHNNILVEATRPEPNKLHYTFPSGSALDITIDDETTVTVIEEGTYWIDGKPFPYQGSYKMKRIEEKASNQRRPIGFRATE